MTQESISNDLFLELNRKLYFAEMEEKLMKVTCSLIDDELYTVDCAIKDLIKIIDQLELEQRSIMHQINNIAYEENNS
ncbi:MULTISPECIES: hypothetical protein [Oceanobacillus]|uniref:hypothetical protein n=1 Tax=Oceanobacillus TaxID=182709 RepID=UPI000595B2E8|nr:MULTISPECIES: hypothetical protein [Oceanobacillus]